MLVFGVSLMERVKVTSVLTDVVPTPYVNQQRIKPNVPQMFEMERGKTFLSTVHLHEQSTSETQCTGSCPPQPPSVPNLHDGCGEKNGVRAGGISSVQNEATPPVALTLKSTQRGNRT